MGRLPTYRLRSNPHIVFGNVLECGSVHPEALTQTGQHQMKRKNRKENPGLNQTQFISNRSLSPASPVVSESSAALLRELVAHLRQNRTQLREEWARRITEAQLLIAMSKDEIFTEATSVYDNYVEVLETGSVEALQAYARNLSERIIPRGVETHEVVGIVLLLRDVLARSLFDKFQADFSI